MAALLTTGIRAWRSRTTLQAPLLPEVRSSGQDGPDLLNPRLVPVWPGTTMSSTSAPSQDQSWSSRRI